MSVLAINDDAKAACRAAVERARAKPIPLERLKALAFGAGKSPGALLKDRKPGARPESEHVEIPLDYRASISFERQPAGLCRHLPVSVHEGKSGLCPSIAALFGFKGLEDAARVWVEEFAPGRFAVNLLKLEEEILQ